MYQFQIASFVVLGALAYAFPEMAKVLAFIWTCRLLNRLL